MLISPAECSSGVSIRKKQELCKSSDVPKVWINLFVTSVQFPTQRIPPCFSSCLLLWTPGAGRFCLKAIGINYNQLIPTFCLPTLFHKGLEHTWNNPQMWAHLLFRNSSLDYNFSSHTLCKNVCKSKEWGCKNTGETSQKKSPAGSRADWKKNTTSSYFKILRKTVSYFSWFHGYLFFFFFNKMS